MKERNIHIIKTLGNNALLTIKDLAEYCKENNINYQKLCKIQRCEEVKELTSTQISFVAHQIGVITGIIEAFALAQGLVLCLVEGIDYVQTYMNGGSVIIAYDDKENIYYLKEVGIWGY